MPDYKILIADYEPRWIEQLRDPLEAAGYQVEIVKDGLKAIQVFGEFKPHLMLLEAMLPKKHGFEVCQELKATAHGKVTPVVIVTSVYKGRRYRTQALHHYGCDEYLEKPVSADDLLATVERLIGQSSFAAEAPAAAPPVSNTATQPAQPSPAPAATQMDDAEFEIMERLDEILPGGDGGRGGSGGPKAQVNEGQLISLDRERERRFISDSVPTPRNPAQRVAVNGGIAPAIAPHPHRELRRPQPPVRTVPEPPPGPAVSLRVLVLIAVLTASLLLLFFGPF